MNKLIIACAALTAATSAFALDVEFGNLKVAADDIAADKRSESMVATGHVDVVCKPYRLMTDRIEKHGDTTVFADPTTVTTCTNDTDHLHWSMSGEVEYNDGNYILGRNQILRMYGLPLLWLPYWYYPIDEVEGLRMMPGYAGRWGVFMLSKYVYHLAGDRAAPDGSYSLKGATRVDLRSRNGVALGQSLRWKLGDYGKGYFKVYHAWDCDYKRYRKFSNSRNWNYNNWISTVDFERYSVDFSHRWDVTERDTLRVMAGVTSDSKFKSDFLRNSVFTLDNRFANGSSNEMAWEHVENGYGMGISVSGRLNDFFAATARLPEYYIDVNPMPVLDTGVNYESQTRLGYLRRNSSRNGAGKPNEFSYVPGHWADYGTFRLDTYHRLTYPLKFWDVVSAVPRLGYRGTYYGESGFEHSEIDYPGKAGRSGHDAFRSIYEGGITFSARGIAWIDDEWQSVLEPYADVLAQHADVYGLHRGERLYVFDGYDASRGWLDQFAGRGRNLPYSYYGVTPGVRKLFRQVDDNGKLRTVFDFDLYAALQFGATSWNGTSKYHRLAKQDKSNYGEDNVIVMPGFRSRWMPNDDTMLGLWMEYDGDNDTLAMTEVEWNQRLDKRFSYFVKYSQRNYRWWDFSSSPYRSKMRNENFNRAQLSSLTVGYEHELITDTIVYSPYIRWDFTTHELDEVGTWIDYLTDCLGFRFLVCFENEYRRIDNSLYKRDWRVGFFLYLRAFGPEVSDVFKY